MQWLNSESELIIIEATATSGALTRKPATKPMICSCWLRKMVIMVALCNIFILFLSSFFFFFFLA